MKQKKALKSFVDACFALLRSHAWGRRIHERLIRSAFETTHEVEHGGVRLRFCVPNEWARVRALTFSEKEPKTLEWIDGFQPGTVLWDVGANLGLYTLYAALRHPEVTVYAFEPSVFNLELLARNVVLNGLEERVTIVPLPLNDTSGTGALNMSMTAWGGAMSTFGRTHGHDGQALEAVFSYRVPSCTLDEVSSFFRIPQPEALKMDVDGIEHWILKGGKETLRSPNLKTLLIEVNDNFAEQRDTVKSLLEEAGWQLKAKQHSEMFENSVVAATFNQIWERK